MVSKLLYTIAGFLLGLAVLGAIFFFYPKNKSRTSSSLTTNKTFNLVLTSSPADGAALSNSKVKIAGTTGSEAVVVVNGGASSSVVQTAGGKFELTYELAEGENEITVTAFDQNSGESKLATRRVLYLTELKNL